MFRKNTSFGKCIHVSLELCSVTFKSASTAKKYVKVTTDSLFVWAAIFCKNKHILEYVCYYFIILKCCLVMARHFMKTES